MRWFPSFFAGSQAGILRTDGKRGRRIGVGVEGGGGCSEGEAGNEREADSLRGGFVLGAAGLGGLVRAGYPGWCEEPCRSVGSVPPDRLAHGTVTEGGSEPPRVSTTVRGGGRHGRRPSPRRQVADRNLGLHLGSSSDEHLEVDTRFPFSPPGSGALRDVA